MLQDLSTLSQLRRATTGRASSFDPTGGNDDWRDIAPGSKISIADIPGPGCITHIWMTFDCKARYFLRTTLIRMFWDGEDDPSVESPVGDFFGVGHGEVRYFMSDAFNMLNCGSGRAGVNCFFPMPFERSAVIEIENQSDKPMRLFYYVDYETYSQMPSDQAYFHARWRREPLTTEGRDYRILDAEGCGHYVGAVLSVDALVPDWWGEGDDKFYIDGDENPTLWGTGTEDYFCHGWGFAKEYAGPYHGATVLDGSKTSVYRLHITGPVRFEKSLIVDIENWGHPQKERVDDYSSVAFWYQTEPHKPWSPMPEAERRLPREKEIPEEAIEGEALAPTAMPVGGSVEIQAIGQDWRGRQGTELLFTPAMETASVTLYIPISEPGDYEISAYLAQGPEHGKWRLMADGEPLGAEVDTYALPSGGTESGPPCVSFGIISRAAGVHRLEFVCAGKNPQSLGYLLGIDAIHLRKI